MRAAIVGCGEISHVHISALQDVEGVEIVAVCDRDRWHAQKAAELAGGAQTYSSLTTLLSEQRPDTVHVLTPPGTHAELAIQSMEAGCHVLVEKPMAINMQQADTMMATARQCRVKLCTDHNYLFKPSVMKLRKLVESGAIGQPAYVTSYYGLYIKRRSSLATSGRNYRGWRLPGGAFIDFLPHLVYLQMAFMQQVDSVAGVGVGRDRGAGNLPTELTASLQGSHCCGTMVVSMRTRPYAKFIDVYGTEGIARADLVREVCTIHRGTSLPSAVSKVVFNLEDSLQLFSGTVANTMRVAFGRLKDYPGLRRLVREFYDSLADDRDPPVTGEDGRRMVEIMEEVWEKGGLQSFHVAAKTATAAQASPRSDAERAVAEKGFGGKVLVTGATGFLGHRLVSALSRCEVDVVAFVRNRDDASIDLERHSTLVQGDLRDPASIASALRGVAVVFHCAAITRNRASWKDHYETNVGGTEAVLKAALEADVRRVVHVSTIDVYGESGPPHTKTVDESMPYGQNPRRWSYYLRSKLEADKLALQACVDDGVPVTVVRPGIIYGSESGRSLDYGPARIGRVNLLVGRGHNLMALTYVDNAVDGLLLAAISPNAIGQAYNIVDQPQLSRREVISQAEDITGQRLVIVPVPPFLLYAAAGLLKLRAGHRSEIPPKVTHYVVATRCRDVHYDTRKAKQDLGWEPAVSLEGGLRRMMGVLPDHG